jgi:hypothetical protein
MVLMVDDAVAGQVRDVEEAGAAHDSERLNVGGMVEDDQLKNKFRFLAYKKCNRISSSTQFFKNLVLGIVPKN